MNHPSGDGAAKALNEMHAQKALELQNARHINANKDAQEESERQRLAAQLRDKSALAKQAAELIAQARHIAKLEESNVKLREQLVYQKQVLREEEAAPAAKKAKKAPEKTATTTVAAAPEMPTTAAPKKGKSKRDEKGGEEIEEVGVIEAPKKKSKLTANFAAAFLFPKHTVRPKGKEVVYKVGDLVCFVDDGKYSGVYGTVKAVEDRNICVKWTGVKDGYGNDTPCNMDYKTQSKYLNVMTPKTK